MLLFSFQMKAQCCKLNLKILQIKCQYFGEFCLWSNNLGPLSAKVFKKTASVTTCNVLHFKVYLCKSTDISSKIEFGKLCSKRFSWLIVCVIIRLSIRMQCCVCVAGWGAAYCTYLTSRGLSIADNLDLVSCEIINDVRKKKKNTNK